MGARYPRTYVELQRLSDEQLAERYDAMSKDNVGARVEFYLDELARRDLARMTAQMVTLTRWIALLTVVNVVLVGGTLFA